METLVVPTKLDNLLEEQDSMLCRQGKHVDMQGVLVLQLCSWLAEAVEALLKT